MAGSPIARAVDFGSVAFQKAVAVSRRLDNWVNVITGLGGSRDKTTRALVYEFVPFTVTELDALYHGGDLPAKIVDAIVEDAFRLGIETGDPAVDAALARWRALETLAEADIWGRLYGGGAVYLGCTDRLGDQASPLDTAQIGPGDLAFLQVLDRQDLSRFRLDDDPESGTFGESATYLVSPPDGSGSVTEVHASRLVMFGGARTSARRRLRNDGWDLSVLQRPAAVLRDFDQSWRSVMLLIQDLSQAVFKIKGLADMIAEGQSSVVMSRMEVTDLARSVARAVVIDADSESFEHTGAQNVTGVDPLLVRLFQRLASAADMPMSRLMGMSSSGLNAVGAGESDARQWYDRVQAHRTAVTPQIRKAVRVIARSEGLAPPEAITWPSLWQESPQEVAAREKLEADTDAVRITSQVMTPEEAARVRFLGEDPATSLDWASRQPPEANALAEAASVRAEIEVPEGSIWIDTADGHRLEVTATTQTMVYFLDLDSEQPGRQHAWVRRTFTERARPHAS